MRVLITGFEPFGGDAENASHDSVNGLEVPDIDVVVRILPVGFRSGPAMLREAMNEVDPDVVVAVGEAGGRSDISIERRAVNLADARIPDNDGYQPRGLQLDDGPDVLYSRLPVADLLAELSVAGLPAHLSDDAGAFVCNAVFRGALRDFSGPAGFIHVPALRTTGTATVGAETDGAQSESAHTADTTQMTLEQVRRALEIIIAYSAKNFAK